MLLIDTGVLLAAADDTDPAHAACVELVETTTDTLVTTAMVIAESGYLIDRQLGPVAEAGFYRSIANGDILVEALAASDYQRMAELPSRSWSTLTVSRSATRRSGSDRARVEPAAALGLRDS
jgi:uncharacterized protein